MPRINPCFAFAIVVPFVQWLALLYAVRSGMPMAQRSP